MAKRDVRRDRAGTGPDPAESRRRLVSIDTISGFRVADGEPDVRGWEVRTLSDRELGSVEDLLIDPDRREVVMLEVGLHGGDIRAEVPIRSVQFDRSRRVVVVDSGDIDAGTTRRAVREAGDPRHTDPPGRTDRPEEYRAQREDEAALQDERHAEVRDDAREDVRAGDVEERVVERRPIVEEVVVRRRRVDE